MRVDVHINIHSFVDMGIAVESLLEGPKNGVYRDQKPENPENPGFNNYCIFGVVYGAFKFK